MFPHADLHTTLTAMRRAEIQQEVTGIRRARLVRTAGVPALGPLGVWLSPVRLRAVLTRALAPGTALPPLA